MKIALFGVSGLLGWAVGRTILSRKHQLFPFSGTGVKNLESIGSATALDLADDPALTRQLLDLWPDVIINCAAISSPDSVDRDPDHAHKINVLAAERLSQISTHLGARFIHVSTDLVFDGSASPYRSTDLPAPVNAYGRQKLEAEKRVLESCPENAVVLRITLINGNSPTGARSQHEKLFRSVAGGGTPTLFVDEFRQPCSADNVADVIAELCERPQLNGLFHWAGGERISRYELGVRIFERFGLSPDLIEKSTRADLADNLGERPGELCFVLEPLVGKLKTRPLGIEGQLQDLRVPDDLFKWFRETSKNPDLYVRRFKTT